MSSSQIGQSAHNVLRLLSGPEQTYRFAMKNKTVLKRTDETSSQQSASIGAEYCHESRRRTDGAGVLLICLFQNGIKKNFQGSCLTMIFSEHCKLLVVFHAALRPSPWDGRRDFSLARARSGNLTFPQSALCRHSPRAVWPRSKSFEIATGLTRAQQTDTAVFSATRRRTATRSSHSRSSSPWPPVYFYL